MKRKLSHCICQKLHGADGEQCPELRYGLGGKLCSGDRLLKGVEDNAQSYDMGWVGNHVLAYLLEGELTYGLFAFWRMW